MRRTIAVCIPVVACLVLLGAGSLEGWAGKSQIGIIGWIPLSLACAGVGSLLWYRRAGGVLAALFLFMGLFLPMGVAVNAYADAARVHGLPAAAWAAWWFQASIAFSSAFFLILQLFPTGRPLTPRWRALVWLTLVTSVLSFAVPAFGPTSLFTTNFPGVRHPLPLLSASVATAMDQWASLLLAAVFVASAVEIVLRYHRSTGDDRFQMKWFASAAAVAAIGFVIGIGVIDDGPALAFALLAPLIPLAAGVAIVKYHLYDIDVVISKTVVFALLAVFISVVYIAIVVGVGRLVEQGDTAVQIAATAIVALLFQPARGQAQRVANRLVFGDRASPYEVMAGFSRRVADTVSVEDVLPEMASAAGTGVGAASAEVRVVLDEGDRTERWGEADVAEGTRTAFAISYQGIEVGEIAVTKGSAEPLTPSEHGLLRDLAGQAGLALHNVRLTEQLARRVVEVDVQSRAIAASRERLVTARDAQRHGLQRDIQEGAERELRQIRQQIFSLADRVETEPAEIATELDGLGERSNATLEGLRDLARGIFPPLLADQGIAPALEAHIRKVGAQAKVEAEPAFTARRFDDDTEACVYFCCLQAIQNVLRHAGNATSTVALSCDHECVTFEVRDEGPGFAVATTARGMGIDIMQDRVDALEGSLSIESAPGEGTRVHGRIPVRIREEVPS